MVKRIVLIVAATLILMFGLYVLARPRPYAPSPSATYVTLIGYTEVTTGHHIATVDINDVPSGHHPFHAIATVPEGTRVELISHTADDALVIAPNGTQGYVSIVFVRELCGNDCP